MRILTTPSPRLSVASSHFVKIASNFALGTRILKTGKVVWIKGVPQSRLFKIRTFHAHPHDPGVVFKVWVKLKGQPKVEGLFKPFQIHYRDGYTELAACQLAARLGVRQPPCVERSFTRKELAPALKLVRGKYKEMLSWEGNRLRGFFRLWAPKFRTRIGRLTPSREKLLRLATKIRPRGSCGKHPICRQLSEVFVFDYLISNNDRPYNVGTVKTSANGVLLYVIDWGDGFSGSARAQKRKWWMKKAFRSLRRFSRPLLHKLGNLSMADLKRVLSDSKGKPLVSEFHTQRAWKTRADILKRVGKIKRRYGEAVFFPPSSSGP